MFEYSDILKIGVPELDEEHRKLIDLLNRGIYLLNEQYTIDKYDHVKELVAELLDYANMHFAREEGYMLKLSDPELPMQKVQHEHFRAKVWEMEFKDINENEDQNKELQDIMSFLTEWLFKHIIGSDGMIGKLEPLEQWMLKENPCEFSEEYKINVPFIDSEHRKLFNTADDIYQMMKRGNPDPDKIISILHELRKYTEEHFSDEEAYMEKMNYSGLEAQKHAHGIFIAEFEDIDEEQIRNNTEEYVDSLLEFLVGWLINHILKVDTQIPKK